MTFCSGIIIRSRSAIVVELRGHVHVPVVQFGGGGLRNSPREGMQRTLRRIVGERAHVVSNNYECHRHRVHRIKLESYVHVGVH